VNAQAWLVSWALRAAFCLCTDVNTDAGTARPPGRFSSGFPTWSLPAYAPFSAVKPCGQDNNTTTKALHVLRSGDPTAHCGCGTDDYYVEPMQALQPAGEFPLLRGGRDGPRFRRLDRGPEAVEPLMHLRGLHELCDLSEADANTRPKTVSCYPCTVIWSAGRWVCLRSGLGSYLLLGQPDLQVLAPSLLAGRRGQHEHHACAHVSFTVSRYSVSATVRSSTRSLSSSHASLLATSVSHNHRGTATQARPVMGPTWRHHAEVEVAAHGPLTAPADSGDVTPLRRLEPCGRSTRPGHQELLLHVPRHIMRAKRSE
jgi:hypothetical protein